MRKLLNTIYITKEDAHLLLEGENLVCRFNDVEKFRIPFDNVESIVCFSYIGCSPAVMGKCVEKKIPISFISPQGKFLAKIVGETRGNIFLRLAQIDIFKEHNVMLATNTIAAKVHNCIKLIKRSMHDNPELRDDNQILHVISALNKGIEQLYDADSLESILGIEGYCAKEYFGIFGKLFTKGNIDFKSRNKRPPLDPINAVLSFLYTLYINEFASALETVGLDSFLGFYHSLRSGRSSLACDLVEECRCNVERLVITLFNLKVLDEKDFDFRDSGAVWLNDDGRKKVITKWQEKKRTDIMHPYLKQKIQFGLLPYIQSNLLAKYVRGEIEEYPPFISG